MNYEHSKVLDFLSGTLSTATSFHTDALGKCQDSRDAYQGLSYGNEQDGRSIIRQCNV